MKITGIITEYNPFHLGHEFHINNSKKKTNADAIICVMSGNFVQRGIPSITDKWSRAKMALLGGVDLVIELPTIYSISSAEFFAFGAISILDSLNVVNDICFGSECGDIETLKEISKILLTEPLEFKEFLKEELSLGLSFPKARSLALERYMKNFKEFNFSNIQDILNSSNNILAIEYCKALLKLNSNINPVTITRVGSNYNDENVNKTSFSSASSIRKIIKEDSLEGCIDIIPKYTYEILSKNKIADINKMFFYVKYKLLSDSTLLTNIPDANEGLGNKILKNISIANSFDELILLCKSKRYSYTRISRVICQCFLSLTKEDVSLNRSRPEYMRILGLNETGAKIIKEIKNNSSINIVNKISKNYKNNMLLLDIKATNLYSLLNDDIPINADFKISPIILK
ncbi:MAG: nucleotidyltransferase [Clostridium perfringens]|nr:nucleotidyltransferase [Clostridium perfringens]